MKKYRSLVRNNRRRISKAGRLLVFVAVIALLTLLYFNGHKKVTTIIPSSSQPSSSGIPSQKSPASSQQPSPSSTSSPKTTIQSAPTTILAGSITAPFGEFVSNHSPSLSNTALSQEYSVCNTTPGAGCYIKFTKDNITRQLAAKTTDNSGTTSWQWDIHDADLTAGNWTIIAVASSSNDTKSTQDTIPLSVQP